jgi:hypothetical protein
MAAFQKDDILLTIISRTLPMQFVLELSRICSLVMTYSHSMEHFTRLNPGDT